MRKRTGALFTACMMLFAIGASAYRYYPPYEDVDGGRAALNMPEIFSADTAQKQLVASDDFNDNTGGSDTLTLLTTMSGEKSFDGGTVKIAKSQTEDAVSVNFKYSGELREMVTYIFTCRVKSENLTAAPRCIVQAYGNSGWIKEVSAYGTAGSSDWQTVNLIITIPEGTTNLRLCAHLGAGVTGTAYYDDFMLQRIVTDPMEAVLLRPNYKGLIYGDGYGDIDLDVVITEDAGTHTPDEMQLSVKLVDGNDVVYREAEADTLSSRMNFVFSSAGLSEGDYYLQTVLSDKTDGDIISKKEITIRKRAESYRPDTYLDENGRIIRNNEKTFLKRIMSSGYAMESATAAKEAGIDAVSSYGYWWVLDPTTENTNALNYMRSNGITRHIAFSDCYYSKRTTGDAKTLIRKQEDILPLFKLIVNDFKNDEVLDGYYLFDEPDPIIYGEEIRWNNEILAQEDINHPTLGVADKGYEYYGIYTKMADILGIDKYPVMGKTDSDGNEIHDDISVVGDSMREIKSNFPNRPVYAVLQGFHWDAVGALRGPTEAELKNMAWQAICEGADGLDWYSYSAMIEDTVETKEQWVTKLNNVFADVAPYEDIILSDEPVPNYSVTGGGDWLNIGFRRFNGKTYLFAVNNTYTAKSATVKIDGAETQSLSFEPLEVKKLEITQPDYLSPEAELKTMGFSNGSESFAVAEGTENILYVPKGSGVINYSAKISDNARLYIGNEEVPENGKITLKLVNSFKVTVVAENGTDKTQKVYRVVKQ